MTLCLKVLIVCGVLVSPGCAAVGNLVVSVTGHVIGDLVVDKVKEKINENEESKDGEKSP
jgi:hypothetical protein